MFNQLFGSSARLRGLYFVCTLLAFGCGAAPWPTSDGQPSALDLTLLDDDAVTIHDDDANDLLELAQRIELVAEPLVVRGDITSSRDVDVYDVGPVVPGDYIQVAVSTDDSLPAAIAAFDETGAALLVNDHRNVFLGRRGPFIDLVIRRESAACFIAISGTPGYDGVGNYALAVSKHIDMPIPEAKPDTILLVFSGADAARIGSRAAVDVPPFDAADISPTYQVSTKDMIARITQKVREDYLGFNVTILSTSEGASYEEHMSRIFFGTYDAALLGVAEGVDEFNQADAQEAIVFTDTFAAFMALNPTVEEMSQAIANVASHEAGHLLGLVHTADPAGIMDVTASLSQLTVDQVFTQSPLDWNVFPVGFENEVQCLLDAVGAESNAIERFTAQTLPSIVRAQPTPSGASARRLAPLSSCCLTHRIGAHSHARRSD